MHSDGTIDDDPRISVLLEALYDSQLTPEEVCDSCPELLPAVRERWQRLREIEHQCEALFPAESAVASPTKEELPEIPGYRVEAIIGRGGMGVVFRARHLELNRAVAMKMVSAGAYVTARDRQRFQREAQAVAALQHPHVVQIHDVGEAAGRPFFTMELLTGGNLAEKIAGTPRPAREAAELVKTLAIAVSAAHDRGIVHRDLKPANVMLTAAGVPKISDFGLARRLDEDAELTRSGALIGTPSYMAPEQAQGPVSAISSSVDIYALGAILYEALTGRPPFRAPSTAETLQQLITQQPAAPRSLNAEVPRDLETICLKCLHKEPAKRYVTATALADDLERFLQGKAITARPEGWLAKSIRLIRRRPIEATSITAALLFAAILIIGGMWWSFERSSAARVARAEQAVLLADVGDELAAMSQELQRSAFPRAKAALERAQAKLRLVSKATNTAGLQQRVAQGEHDLQLAARLDEIRMHGAESIDGRLVLQLCDTEYDAAFRATGFGGVTEDAAEVAKRVKASDIRAALLAALDHWSICTKNAIHQKWILQVASQADADSSPWRIAARNPSTRGNVDEVHKLVVAANVADTPLPLLLALELKLAPNSAERMRFLKRIVQVHPDDFWANFRLGIVQYVAKDFPEAVASWQAAVALRKNSAYAHHNLGGALEKCGRPDEAAEHYARAVELDPAGPTFQASYAMALWELKEHEQARRQVQAALRLRPNDARLRSALAQILDADGDPEGALVQFRQTVKLDPQNRGHRKDFQEFLLRRAYHDEAISLWQQSIEESPRVHEVQYGYAEYCLFAGRREAYDSARSQLLKAFGQTKSAQLAERVSRACLLAPASGDELKTAAALAELAGQTKGGHPAHFQLALAFAEFRQQRLDSAISILRGEAASALPPVPKLLLAMALHQQQKTDEAKAMLVDAVLTHDWRTKHIHDQDGWIIHVLRREAEHQLVSDWDTLATGKREPQNDDERIMLLAHCQFERQWKRVADLYAATVAIHPHRSIQVFEGHRHRAAFASALAAAGKSTDARDLPDEERQQLRSQALRWLRDDLRVWRGAYEKHPDISRPTIQGTVGQWSAEPSLAGLREPAELAKLSDAEQKECAALWEEVSRVLALLKK